MKKVGIVGLGNLLRKDDGIGLVLLDKLRNNSSIFPNTFNFIDGGTGGLNLIHVLSDYNIIILLDAVNFDENPGESKFFNVSDFDTDKNSKYFLTHEPNFIKVIELTKKLGIAPDLILIFGIQPKNVSFGPELSKDLKENLKKIYDNFVDSIKEYNFFKLK